MFWCSCRFAICFHHNVLSSSFPSRPSCVWVFIPISIVLRWEFSSLCLDYVICVQQFLLCCLCFHACTLLFAFVLVLQVASHFIVLQLFFAFVLRFVEMFCFLWSIICILCFIETLLVLVFSFYWSIFCFGVLTLLKHFSLYWNTSNFDVGVLCFTKSFVTIFFISVFVFHTLLFMLHHLAICSASPSSNALLHSSMFFLPLFVCCCPCLYLFIFLMVFVFFMFVGNGGFAE
jgi:hypothetical protein